MQQPSGGGWGASSELQNWEQRGAGHVCENKYALLKTKPDGHAKDGEKRSDGDWTLRIVAMVGALDPGWDFVGVVFCECV